MTQKQIKCTYLCPIRLNVQDDKIATAYNEYWKRLERYGCEVLVVDGSSRENFNFYDQHWQHCIHIPVDERYKNLNGKVNGIWTGLQVAGYEKIILADDDIRYGRKDIVKMIAALEHNDMVRPQNFFQPLTLPTKIDTARVAINRTLLATGDFPGTFGFRKQVALAAGKYDGDVLFDNEEMMRHLAHFGARVSYRTDFFIMRKSPNFKKWLEQRPRQAYEDFVMKRKTLLFLSIIPAHSLLFITGKHKALATLLASTFTVSTTLAIAGTIRDRAWKYLPIQTALYAPLWVLERSVSIYIALYWKYVKGGYPFGSKILKKGTGSAWNAKKVADFDRSDAYLTEIKRKERSQTL